MHEDHCNHETHESHGHGHSHGAHGCGARHAHHHGAFGRRGFKPPFGPGGHAQAVASFMGQGGRARRGDVRSACLRLLAEEPMHGYQIIQELSERTGGAWSPSAGSVYPTLQLLADEGLVSAEESGGKKVFSLTPTGVEAAAKLADEPAPWEDATADVETPAGVFRAETGKLMQALWQLGTSGTASQLESATAIVTDARKKLYTLLAED